MPSPGQIVGGQALALAAYKAINYVRLIAEQSPDSDSGAALAKFFRECAKFCPKQFTAEQMEAREAARVEAARQEAEARALAATETNTAGGRGRTQ